MATEYKITVNFGGQGEGDSSFAVPEPTSPQDSKGSSWDPISGGKNFLTDMKGFAKAIPGASIIKQTFDWQVSLVGRYTGSEAAQQRANAGMTIAGQVGGIVMGFAAGGAVGGLLAIAATGLSYLKEIDQSNYDRKWENIDLRLQRERGGVSLNRSRAER